MQFGRRLLAAAGLVPALLLVGCVDAASSPEEVRAPVLGWLVDDDGCRATPDEVRAQAAELVRSGLAETGYRTLYVSCSRSALSRDASLSAELADDGLSLQVIAPSAWPVTEAISTRGSRPEALRTAVTRQVMAAGPVVFGGPVGELSEDVRSIVGNREVAELALDGRRAPGAPVGDDATVWSRAFATKGLLVSLRNGGPVPAERAVAIELLNLAGEDSVPARDVWTGQRLMSDGGLLSVRLVAGDTALLRIG